MYERTKKEWSLIFKNPKKVGMFSLTKIDVENVLNMIEISSFNWNSVQNHVLLNKIPAVNRTVLRSILLNT